MTNSRICVLCAHYYPRATPHPPDLHLGRQQTSGSGTSRLEHELLGLRASFLRLQEAPGLEAGANDTVSQQLPAAPIASPSNQPIVSGSRERRLPIDLTREDLLLPARPGHVYDPNYDQVGPHSVASVLDEWVAAWHDRWYAGQHYPAADAVSLIDWILAARLEYAADHTEVIAVFAGEIGALRGAIRRALGDQEPRPQVMWGITCPSCEKVSQLTLDPDDPDRRRTCEACGLLLSEDEYRRHLRALAEQYRPARPVAPEPAV